MGAWRIFFGREIVGYAVLDIQRQAFVHRHGVGVGGDGVSEKPLAPFAGVADAAGDVCVPALEGAARGVGQDERGIEFAFAQSMPMTKGDSLLAKVSTSAKWSVPSQRPASFSCVSRVRRAAGCASRRRSMAGRAMMASPSQLTPRMRMFCGALILIWGGVSSGCAPRTNWRGRAGCNLPAR